jgi:hypothetical protein
MFRKLDLFPSSGEGKEILTLLSPLERANLNYWTSKEKANLSPYLETERGPVPETLCFLVFRNPDDGQSPNTQ